MAMEPPGGQQGIVAVAEIEKGVLVAAPAGGGAGFDRPERHPPLACCSASATPAGATSSPASSSCSPCSPSTGSSSPRSTRWAASPSRKLIPSEISLENFETVLNDQPFWTWFRNTMVICPGVGLLHRDDRRLRGLRLLPPAVQGPPGRPDVAAAHPDVPGGGRLRRPSTSSCSGSATCSRRWASAPCSGSLLVYLGGAMGINAWLIKGFFDTIPKELDESAKMDGASHVQIFFKVILPVAAADPRRGVRAVVPLRDQRVPAGLSAAPRLGGQLHGGRRPVGLRRGRLRQPLRPVRRRFADRRHAGPRCCSSSSSGSSSRACSAGAVKG